MALKFTDDQFFEYTDKLEGGSVTWMFLIWDPNGGYHVATGFGITFMKVSDATALDWLYREAGGASKAQIEADYAAIQKRTDLAGGPGKPHKMGGDPVWKTLTGCRLTKDGLKKGVIRLLKGKLAKLRMDFPEFDEWPADAQLAAVSVQWAGDVKSGWPKLTKACRAQDWEAASKQCTFQVTKDTNAFLALRSKRQVILFRNAQRVKDGEALPDHLNWNE
jgi:hypothetical protein